MKAPLPPIETDSAKRSAIMDRLWTNAKYLKLQARKDRLLREWNEADAYKNSPHGSHEKAAKADKAVKRAMKRVWDFERAHGL